MPPSPPSTTTIGSELSVLVRAGCFTDEDEAMREAVQTLFASKPNLRVEMAIRLYVENEITLGRAAELAGMTQWRFLELLAQRSIRHTIEARPTKELDTAVDRIMVIKHQERICDK